MAAYNMIAAAMACLDEDIRSDERFRQQAVWERLAAPELRGEFPVAWMGDGGTARVCPGYFAGVPDADVLVLFRPGLDPERVHALNFLHRLRSALLGVQPPAIAAAAVDPDILSHRESMAFCRSFRESLPTRGRLDLSHVPRRERGYLARRGEVLTERTLLPAAQAGGQGLAELAGQTLRLLTGRRMEGRRVLVPGRGPLAEAAAAALVRRGCELVPPGAAAELAFLAGTSPLTAEDAEELCSRGIRAVFEGELLAVSDDGVRRLREWGILFVPGLLGGAGTSMPLPMEDRWEALRVLRRTMGELLEVSLRAGEGDLCRGAYAAALTAAGEELLRRGI